MSETSEEIPVASVENGGTGKLVAKAKPRPKPTLTLTPVPIPYRERKWIDVDPGKFNPGCFEVSKFMIRLLRHDGTVHREDDGVVRFDDLAEKFKAKFDGTSQWPIEAWITFLAKGGGPKKRFQYSLNPNSSKHILYFRAIQGHSGHNLVDPALQDPDDFAEYIYHIGNAHDMHFIIQGGSIPGGRSLKRYRHSVFFTAVNSMYANQDLEDVQYDLDKPRITMYKNTWRVHQKKKNSILVQSETRSKKRIAVLSNRIPRNRSFQHTTCDLYYMKTGEDFFCKKKKTPIPKVTASCTQAKFATWTSGSF